MRGPVSKILLIFYFLIVGQTVIAQLDTVITGDNSPYSDSTRWQKKKLVKSFHTKWNLQPHSPLQATVRSAIIPGWGQVYNGHKREGSFVRKYWRVPVVYAGLMVCTGYIIYNTDKYRYFRQQYIYQQDNDINTNPDINATNLFEIQDQYHRWMDISYFALAGVYILQIIEANVDAHLFYFDVGKDIGLRWHPSILPASGMRPALGLTISF